MQSTNNTRACDFCGTLYTQWREWQRFCCVPCRSVFHSRQKRKYEPVVKTKETKCIVCGVSFLQLRKVNHKTCSVKCRIALQLSRTTKMLPPNCTCDYCGKGIHKAPHIIRKYPTHFCDLKCLGSYNEQKVGMLAPNWRGGEDPARKDALQRKTWKRLREQVIIRDGARCSKCGTSGVRLQCHHVNPWRKTKKDELSNLTMLCVSCHGKQTVIDWERDTGKSWQELCKNGRKTESVAM